MSYNYMGLQNNNEIPTMTPQQQQQPQTQQLQVWPQQAVPMNGNYNNFQNMAPLPHYSNLPSQHHIHHQPTAHQHIQHQQQHTGPPPQPLQSVQTHPVHHIQHHQLHPHQHIEQQQHLQQQQKPQPQLQLQQQPYVNGVHNMKQMHQGLPSMQVGHVPQMPVYSNQYPHAHVPLQQQVPHSGNINYSTGMPIIMPMQDTNNNTQVAPNPLSSYPQLPQGSFSSSAHQLPQQPLLATNKDTPATSQEPLRSSHNLPSNVDILTPSSGSNSAIATTTDSSPTHGQNNSVMYKDSLSNQDIKTTNKYSLKNMNDAAFKMSPSSIGLNKKDTSQSSTSYSGESPSEGSTSGSASASTTESSVDSKNSSKIPLVSNDSFERFIHKSSNTYENNVKAEVASNHKKPGLAKKAHKKTKLGTENEESQMKKKKPKNFSCSMCKRRKIKCDGATPICGSCASRNLSAAYCVYNSSPWISAAYQEKKLLDEVSVLKSENSDLSGKILVLEKLLRTSFRDSDTTIETEKEESKNTSNNVISYFEIEKQFSKIILFKAELPDPTIDIPINIDLGDFSENQSFDGPLTWKALLGFDDDFKYISSTLKSIETQTKAHEVKSVYTKEEEIDSSETLTEEDHKNCNETEKCMHNFKEDFDFHKTAQKLKFIQQLVNDTFPDLLDLRIIIDNFFNGMGPILFFSIFLKSDIYETVEEVFNIDLNKCTEFTSKKKYYYTINDKSSDLIVLKISKLFLIIGLSIVLGPHNFSTPTKNEKVSVSLDVEPSKFPYAPADYDILTVFENNKDFVLIVENFVTKCLTLSDVVDIESVLSVEVLLATAYFIYLKPGESDKKIDIPKKMNHFLCIAVNISMSLGLHANVDIIYVGYPLAYVAKLKNIWLALISADVHAFLATGYPLTKRWENKDFYTGILKHATKTSASMIKSTRFIRKTIDDLVNLPYLDILYHIKKIDEFVNKTYAVNFEKQIGVIENSNLQQHELFFNFKQLNNYLYYYQIKTTLLQSAYLLENNDLVAKKKHMLWSLKYSLTQLNYANKILNACDRSIDKYKLNDKTRFLLASNLSDITMRSVLFTLSSILKEIKSPTPELIITPDINESLNEETAKKDDNKTILNLMDEFLVNFSLNLFDPENFKLQSILSKAFHKDEFVNVLLYVHSSISTLRKGLEKSQLNMFDSLKSFTAGLIKYCHDHADRLGLKKLSMEKLNALHLPAIEIFDPEMTFNAFFNKKITD